jgi:hypothetical protein
MCGSIAISEAIQNVDPLPRHKAHAHRRWRYRSGHRGGPRGWCKSSAIPTLQRRRMNNWPRPKSFAEALPELPRPSGSTWAAVSPIILRSPWSPFFAETGASVVRFSQLWRSTNSLPHVCWSSVPF